MYHVHVCFVWVLRSKLLRRDPGHQRAGARNLFLNLNFYLLRERKGVSRLLLLLLTCIPEEPATRANESF